MQDVLSCQQRCHCPCSGLLLSQGGREQRGSALQPVLEEGPTPTAFLCGSLGMWNNCRSSQPSCCSQSSAHGGRAGSSMRTEIQFTAGKAPALSRTHLLFLLVVQLSDCCLHISSLLSTDDIAGKGVWNNLTVWELHANSIRLRIPIPH